MTSPRIPPELLERLKNDIISPLVALRLKRPSYTVGDTALAMRDFEQATLHVRWAAKAKLPYSFRRAVRHYNRHGLKTYRLRPLTDITVRFPPSLHKFDLNINVEV